jgi:hypothetical protein
MACECPGVLSPIRRECFLPGAVAVLVCWGMGATAPIFLILITQPGLPGPAIPYIFEKIRVVI